MDAWLGLISPCTSEDVVAEVAHHRAVRLPAKAFRHLEPIAVERAQLDDAEPVELDQSRDALRIGERIGRDDLLEGPMAEAAQRKQQQLAIGDHRFLLGERELAAQRLPIGDAPREIGEIHFQHAQHFVDARERHVAFREDALDARFGHAELAREVGVGDARGLELGLQRTDKVLGGAHRRAFQGSKYRQIVLAVRSGATSPLALDAETDPGRGSIQLQPEPPISKRSPR